LRKKRELMKTATEKFSRLMDYETGEITAAGTFYLAEIYSHFSKALMTSERPVLTFDYYEVRPGDTLSAIAKRNHSDVERIAYANNLNKSSLIVAGKKLKIPRGLYPAELEQYELALEEKAYPFEEKAIHVHESNLKLISRGVYNVWIEKSLQKLAEFVPARYDKPEESSGIISSLETYVFEINRPEQASAVAKTEESVSGNPLKAEGSESVTEPENAGSARADDAGLSATETDQATRR